MRYIRKNKQTIMGHAEMILTLACVWGTAPMLIWVSIIGK